MCRADQGTSSQIHGKPRSFVQWNGTLGLTAILTLVGAHLWIRLQPVVEVFGSSEHEPMFMGSDGFYHAHRMELLFREFPKLVFHDRFMFYPEGAIAHWPLGFDWTVAATLRLFTSDWQTALWWLPWTSVVISLVTLASFVALAHVWMPRAWALLLSGAFALNLAFVRVSTPAELDHHVVECLAVLWLIALPIALGPSRPRWLGVLLGVGLAWMVWNTTLLAFPLAGFFVLWLIALQVCGATPPSLSAFGVALCVPLVVCSAIEAHARQDYFALASLSLLHAGMVGVALLLLVASNWVSPLRLWLAIVGVGIPAGIMLSDGATWIMSFVDGSDPIIGNISEARSLFVDLRGFTLFYAHVFFGPAYVLVPIALFALGRQVWRTRDPAMVAQAACVLMAGGLFALSLSQKRFAHIFAPAFVLILGLWAVRSAYPRLFLIGVVALVLEPAVVHWDAMSHAVPSVARQYVHVAHVVRDAAQGRPERGVSAPPNFGSAINYAAHLPSVTNGFLYPKYLKADLTLRTFEPTADLVAYLRQQNLGYFVAIDDARYRTMLLRMFDLRSEADRASVWEQTPCRGELLRYAYDRLACGVDSSPELEVLLREQRSQDPGLLWRRLTVFRVRT